MSWRNYTIRFTNVGWEPYVNVERDDFGRKTLRGLTGHMLDFIIKTMGMKYEVTFPNDHLWGTKLANGSWTGMIGDLANNAADIAIGPFVMTEAEAEVAIPSLPYTDEDLVIVSGVQKEHESNVYGYITTMDYQVWLLLLASCLIIMCVIGVMDLYFSPELSLRHRKERFYRIFWVYWAAIFRESSIIQFYTAPHRLMLGSWLLGTMFIMNTFVCYMESTLMVKSETFRINNVEQLIKRREIKPMIYDVGGYKSIYQNAESMTFKQVMDQVNLHGGETYGDELFTPTYLRLILNKQAVILLEPLSLFTRIKKQCSALRGEGLFHLSKQRILQIKMVFYMRKKLDRRIQAELQKRVRLVIDSGIFRHWHNRYIYDKGNCWTAEYADHMHDYDDLHYSDLASIFYLYFAALAFSFAVLVIEILYRRGFCCCKYREERDEDQLLKMYSSSVMDGDSPAKLSVGSEQDCDEPECMPTDRLPGLSGHFATLTMHYPRAPFHFSPFTQPIVPNPRRFFLQALSGPSPPTQAALGQQKLENDDGGVDDTAASEYDPDEERSVSENGDGDYDQPESLYEKAGNA